MGAHDYISTNIPTAGSKLRHWLDNFARTLANDPEAYCLTQEQADDLLAIVTRFEVRRLK